MRLGAYWVVLVFSAGLSSGCSGRSAHEGTLSEESAGQGGVLGASGAGRGGKSNATDGGAQGSLGGDAVGGAASSEAGATGEAGSDAGLAAGGRLVILEAPEPKQWPEDAVPSTTMWQGIPALEAGSLSQGVLSGVNQYSFEPSPAPYPDWPTRELFIWTEANGLVPVEGLEPLGPQLFRSKLVTPDGATIIGDFNRLLPGGNGDTFGGLFRWNREEGAHTLGEPAGTITAQLDFISPTGNAAAGFVTTDELEFAPYLWTKASGFQLLEGLPGYPDAYVMAISADGSTLVSMQSMGSLVRGSEAQGYTALPTLPGTPHCFAEYVVADTNVIFGRCNAPNQIGVDVSTAFRWTTGGGIQALPDDGSGCGQHVEVALADGSAAAGVVDCAGKAVMALWSLDDGLTALPRQIGGQRASYRLATPGGLSADGKVLLGTLTTGVNYIGDPGSKAFRWSKAEGLTTFEPLPGHELAIALAADADSEVMAGRSGIKNTESQAVLWDHAGVRGIAAELAARGVDVAGLNLVEAVEVAVHGSTIVVRGSGRTETDSFTFIAWLPVR